MTYDCNGWNWQDSVAAVLVWVGLPALLFGMRARQRRRWIETFGERKPR